MGPVREDTESPSKGSAEQLHPRDILCSERGRAGQRAISRCGFTAREHKVRWADPVKVTMNVTENRAARSQKSGLWLEGAGQPRARN